MAKRLVVDLDGTICTESRASQVPGEPRDYASARPIKEIVEFLRVARSRGWRIVVHTARGMGSGTLDQEMKELTAKWLVDNGVSHDELIFGKPPADLYVDDKAINPKSILSGIDAGIWTHDTYLDIVEQRLEEK